METTGDKDRQEGRQGKTRPREGGHTIQHFGNKTSGRRTHHPTQVHTCGETMGENGEQWGTRGDKTLKRRAHHSKGNKKGDGRQWKTTRGDKTLGRRTHHPTQTHFVGRQSETRGDKTSGRRTRHPTQAHMWGDNERQDVRKADAPSNTDTHVGRQWETLGDKGETRHRERKHIIQHRHTCGDETMG